MFLRQSGEEEVRGSWLVGQFWIARSYTRGFGYMASLRTSQRQDLRFQVCGDAELLKYSSKSMGRGRV